MLSGIAFGSLRGMLPPRRSLLLGAGGDDRDRGGAAVRRRRTWLLALLLVLAGVGIAPTLISASRCPSGSFRPPPLTEGLTWVTTALVDRVLGRHLAVRPAGRLGRGAVGVRGRHRVRPVALLIVLGDLPAAAGHLTALCGEKSTIARDRPGAPARPCRHRPPRLAAVGPIRRPGGWSDV